jgi:hypothetical protein
MNYKSIDLLHQGTLSSVLKDQSHPLPKICGLSAANVITATDLKTQFLISWNDKGEELHIFNLKDIAIKKNFSRKILPMHSCRMRIKRVEAITGYKDTGFVVGSYVRQNNFDYADYAKILSFNITPDGLVTNVKQVAGLELRYMIQDAYEMANKPRPEYINIEAAAIIIQDNNKVKMLDEGPILKIVQGAAKLSSLNWKILDIFFIYFLSF